MVTFDSPEIIQKAAERGDPFAEFELALAFEYGNDCEEDFERAFDLVRESASQGHGGAEGSLHVQHIPGQTNRRKPETVFGQLKKRAESGP